MTHSDKVEALAREMGWYAKAAGFDPGVTPWAIDCTAMTYGKSPHVLIQKLGTDGRYSENWRVTPPEALLLLHLARLGPTRERCPACEERGGAIEWGQANVDGVTKAADWAARKRAGGWQASHFRIGGYRHRVVFSSACPTCTGPAVECEVCHGSGNGPLIECGRCVGKGKVPGKPTGWVTREHGWAERWLRARPTECQGCPACDGTIDDDGPRCVGLVQPGDPEARADLWVLADQLQDKPDPIGDALALCLSGAPCRVCSGLIVGPGELPCSYCKGHGKAYAAATARLIEASP